MKVKGKRTSSSFLLFLLISFTFKNGIDEAEKGGPSPSSQFFETASTFAHFPFTHNPDNNNSISRGRCDEPIEMPT